MQNRLVIVAAVENADGAEQRVVRPAQRIADIERHAVLEILVVAPGRLAMSVAHNEFGPMLENRVAIELDVELEGHALTVGIAFGIAGNENGVVGRVGAHHEARRDIDHARSEVDDALPFGERRLRYDGLLRLQPPHSPRAFSHARRNGTGW